LAAIITAFSLHRTNRHRRRIPGTENAQDNRRQGAAASPAATAATRIVDATVDGAAALAKIAVALRDKPSTSSETLFQARSLRLAAAVPGVPG
jgi:hypothetical protein